MYHRFPRNFRDGLQQCGKNVGCLPCSILNAFNFPQLLYLRIFDSQNCASKLATTFVRCQSITNPSPTPFIHPRFFTGHHYTTCRLPVGYYSTCTTVLALQRTAGFSLTPARTCSADGCLLSPPRQTRFLRAQAALTRRRTCLNSLVPVSASGLDKMEGVLHKMIWAGSKARTYRIKDTCRYFIGMLIPI